MTSVTTSRRLTMGDVDAVQIYAPNYFRYMDAGLHELLVTLGHPLRQLLADGYGMPAVNASCEYFAPAGLDDVLECTTFVARVGTASFDVVHQFHRVGALIARGLMTHVWVEISEAQTAKPVPDWLRSALVSEPVSTTDGPPAASTVAPQERLAGVATSNCPECGRLAYPPEPECLTCGARPTPSRSGADGTLVTWTTVHQAPEGFTAPYVLGWVELSDTPLPVLGRFTDEMRWPLSAGTPVSVTTDGSSDLVLLEAAS